MTLATLAASAVLGLNAAPELTKTKIVDATLFKNGTAVAVHQVTIPASGEVFIEEPPIAALGTLWIYGNQGAQISSVVMTTVHTEKESNVAVGSVGEALVLNKGKMMSIRWYDQKEWKDVTGKIVEVSNQLAIIEPEGSTERMFVQLSSIASFKGSSDLTWTRVVKSANDIPALRITAKAGSKVNIMGLQSGMSWVPAYQVDMSDEKKLQIISKATVVNDLGDLDGIEARLVTGFPNFSNLGMWDPLTYVAQLMQRGGSGGFGGGGAAAAPMQNAAGFRREAADEDAYSSFVPNTGEGFSGEDLFFTPLENVKLKRGERGYYVLFQTDSAYNHLYTLDLPPSTAQGGSRDYIPSELPVWHEIEFDNKMKQPWTTGTALIMQNGQMLGMDELKYTTPGTKAYLKISKALDIAASMTEEEIARERGVLKNQYNQITHDLVTVKGKLELTNYKGLDVVMKISKQLEGEVVTAGGSEKIFKSAKRLNQVNPASVIEWRPTMKKGEKRVFEYTYKVYVSAN
ncbi:MAG: hypothetical protein ACKVQS_06410 [Fimbriimonadaceae bacterium]